MVENTTSFLILYSCFLFLLLSFNEKSMFTFVKDLFIESFFNKKKKMVKKVAFRGPRGIGERQILITGEWGGEKRVPRVPHGIPIYTKQLPGKLFGQSDIWKNYPSQFTQNIRGVCLLTSNITLFLGE